MRREAVAPYLRDFDGWRRMGLGHFADSTVLWTLGDSGDWAQRFVERVPGLQLKSYGGSRAFASSRGVSSWGLLLSGTSQSIRAMTTRPAKKPPAVSHAPERGPWSPTSRSSALRRISVNET